MNVLGIIPSRYASTRFPGKPLAMIGEKSMINRVYDQAIQAIEYVYVATDDQRIFKHVKDFGGSVVYTIEDHETGTSRCAEALEIIERETGIDFDIVLNIQGDEPFIDPQPLKDLINVFKPYNQNVQIATLIKTIHRQDELFNKNTAKVILSKGRNILYFSRSPIPFNRDLEESDWLSKSKHTYFKHVGIYAFRTDILREITELPYSSLEEVEKLEQLNWLEHNYSIKAVHTTYESLGVDTPEDLQKVIERFL